MVIVTMIIMIIVIIMIVYGRAASEDGDVTDDEIQINDLQKYGMFTKKCGMIYGMIYKKNYNKYHK